MKSEVFNMILAGFYVLIILAFGMLTFWMAIQRRKNTGAMRKNIYAKLTRKIPLSAKDITNIGKSFDLTAFQSRKVVYKLFRDTDSLESFNSLNKLIQEIEIEEPFDDLPDEVKPSLVRLKKISEDTCEESDNHILAPIVHTLGKYVEQKIGQEKLKKQTYRAYIVTVISFAVGAVSFYFTLTAPTAQDIAKEIQIVSLEKVIEDN